MIVRDGLAAVGVNALAREAGCDKVLIYRYFGDLDGVYATYAAQSDFWWNVDDLTRGIDPSRTPAAEAMKTIAAPPRRGAARAAGDAGGAGGRTRRIARALVVALEAVRERRALELSAWIGEHYRLPPSLDFEAVAMLLGVADQLSRRARADDSRDERRGDQDGRRLGTDFRRHRRADRRRLCALG